MLIAIRFWQERHPPDPHESICRAFLAPLNELIESALAHPQQPLSLEEFIGQLLDDLKALPNRIWTPEEKPLVNELLEDVVQALEIELSRPDYDPIEDLFALVWESTKKFYELSGIDLTGCPVETTFTQKHDTGKPHDLPCPYVVTGGIDFWDRGSAPVSDIRLVMCLGELDWLSFLAMSYAMFHESVAHALQGPWRTDRDHPPKGSVFSEGWMDFVAVKAHEHVLEGRAGNALAEGFSFIPARLDVAEDFSFARRVATGRDVDWYYRLVGYDAARRLLAAFRLEGSTAANPLAALVRLSFHVNRSELTLTERDLLATWVGLLLSEPALRPVGQAGSASDLVAMLVSCQDSAHVPQLFEMLHDRVSVIPGYLRVI